ncbi:high frequency lysogenization protein HflD [Thiohalobacter thiocyanaticus]|uniref:High frequency lysogenization protein HflD homolog n=1 Tax=Thiohalobacter thiocyanaticus TaxID=585455 RepID=A0A426QE28_9GAMM|nr:high frequency lysogenization protein HflD [Thiohalobacter thiocyanaticus]RRQ19991.1 lysogenization regulator HflD [Thiohalobacter thiocyanaticus]
MSQSLADRSLALGGLFQAALLVREYAHTGRADSAERETLIHSLLVTEPDSTAEVYGGVAPVRRGLEALIQRLGGGRGPAPELEVTRYVIALLHLARKLQRRRDLIQILTDGISQARHQAEYFSPTHENVIAALADLYQQTVSTLTPRIMVQGEPAVLGTPDNQNWIRTLLLAGIRSAVLWEQSGGRRWQLLFKRRALLGAAQSLLETVGEPAG